MAVAKVAEVAEMIAVVMAEEIVEGVRATERVGAEMEVGTAAVIMQMARTEGKEVVEMGVVSEEGVKGQVTAKEMAAVVGVVVMVVEATVVAVMAAATEVAKAAVMVETKRVEESGKWPR